MKSKPKALLFSLLEKNFFPSVEALGFVRDTHSYSVADFACFRRKVGENYQAFSIRIIGTSERFYFHFTELPPCEIEIHGEVFTPTNILPGNIYFLYGTLMQAIQDHHSCTRNLFLRFSESARLQRAESLAKLFIKNFKEVLEWWETKKEGKHLQIFHPKEIPKKPDFSPVEAVHLRHPNIIQRFFAHKNSCWAYYLLLAIAMGAAISLPYEAPSFVERLRIIIALLPVGFIFIFLFPQIALIPYFLVAKMNGAPFVKGDIVQVIGGKHAGKVARVYEEWNIRSEIRIAIDRESWLKVEDVFSTVQLLRLSPKQNNIKQK